MSEPMVPSEALDAACLALEGWKWPDDGRGAVRDVVATLLEAAAPLLVADALKAAARATFEDAIGAATDEAVGARLATIEAEVRASERRRIRQLAIDKGATVPCRCGSGPMPFAVLIGGDS